MRDDDARWDESMPAVYDRILGPALFAPFAERLAALAVPIAPERVLETAAGTGVLTRSLVAALPAAEIIATDLNPAMVAWGAEHAAGAQWQVADAQALDHPDATFELAVCQFGVMFFPDRVAAHTEAARVLRPGAPLLLAIWDAVAGSAFPAALVEALAVVVPHDPPDFVIRVPHGYTDPDRIAADLRAGGFVHIDIDPVVLTGACPSARTLAEGFCRGTPLRFALADRGPLAELTDAVADEMQRRLGTGTVTGDLTAHVVTARTGDRRSAARP